MRLTREALCRQSVAAFMLFIWYYICMQVAMFGKNYITIAIGVLSIILLCVAIWAIYGIYFSGNAFIKVPLLNNVLIAKNTDSDILEKVLFNRYLSYMSNRGYMYLSEERMGGMLSFEKDGKRIFVSYPMFIRIKQGFSNSF